MNNLPNICKSDLISMVSWWLVVYLQAAKRRDRSV